MNCDSKSPSPASTGSSPYLNGRPLRSGRSMLGQAMVFLFAGVLIAIISYHLLRSAPGQNLDAAGAVRIDTIPWRTDLPAALAEARKTGKPVLVDFSATWCPPCQQMQRSAWPDPQVEQVVKSSYVPVLMDADDPRDSTGPAQRYGVREIPTLLVLDAEGRIIRQGAFMSAGELSAFLRKDLAR